MLHGSNVVILVLVLEQAPIAMLLLAALMFDVFYQRVVVHWIKLLCSGFVPGVDGITRCVFVKVPYCRLRDGLFSYHPSCLLVGYFGICVYWQL